MRILITCLTCLLLSCAHDTRRDDVLTVIGNACTSARCYGDHGGLSADFWCAMQADMTKMFNEIYELAEVPTYPQGEGKGCQIK
jgi:hypothetical protein